MKRFGLIIDVLAYGGLIWCVFYHEGFVPPERKLLLVFLLGAYTPFILIQIRDFIFKLFFPHLEGPPEPPRPRKALKPTRREGNVIFLEEIRPRGERRSSRKAS